LESPVQPVLGLPKSGTYFLKNLKFFFSLFIFFFYLLEISSLYFHFYFLSFFNSFKMKISKSLEFEIQPQQKIPKPDFNSNNRFQQIPREWKKKRSKSHCISKCKNLSM